jgi:hypothetical protein
VLVVLGVYLVGRRDRQSSQQQIAMEAASCTQTMNGKIKIEANFWRDLLVIAFLGAVLMLTALGAMSDLSFNSLLLLLIVAGATSVPLVILGRSLFNPHHYFFVGARQLEIRRGASKRRSPFSDVSEYHITTGEGQMSWKASNSTIHHATVTQKLKSGESTPLGLLSG